MVYIAKIIISIISLLISGLLFMLVWNLVLPVVFGIPTISFFQSLGLLILVDIVLSYIYARIIIKKTEVE